MTLKLLADMNLSPLTVAALKADGYDVVTQRLRQVLPQIKQRLSTGCAVTVGDSTVRIRELPIHRS